jgi:hypothetical protein
MRKASTLRESPRPQSTLSLEGRLCVIVSPAFLGTSAAEPVP